MQQSKKVPSQPTTIGYFGKNLTETSHRFVLKSEHKSQPIELWEDYGMTNYAPKLRAIILQDVWKMIMNDVRQEFNNRLQEYETPKGSWRAGDNHIDQLLGKELCVLAWSTERAAPTGIINAINRWLSLRPEYRWMLYNFTQERGGEPEKAMTPWRVLLRHDFQS
jgi:hypothetical protein